MRYFFFKNSNEQTKNMFSYVENYVQGQTNNAYSFTHTTDALYQAYIDGPFLNIVHKLADATKFKSEPYPFTTMDLHELADLVDIHNSIHLVAVDVPTNTSDTDMLERAKLAYITTDGFYDPQTRQKLNQSPASILLFSIVKIGASGIYVVIFHHPFVVPAMEGTTSTSDMTCVRIKDLESIKSCIFPMNTIEGVRATVSNNIIFAYGNKLVFSITNPIIKDGADLTVTTSVEYPCLFDRNAGTLTIDLTQMPVGKNVPLRVTIDGGNFMNHWINSSQRMSYEYMISKTV